MGKSFHEKGELFSNLFFNILKKCYFVYHGSTCFFVYHGFTCYQKCVLLSKEGQSRNHQNFRNNQLSSSFIPMFLLSYLCHTPCFFYPCLPSTCQIKVSHKPLLNKGSVLGKEKRRKRRTWLNSRHLIWENGLMNFSQRIGWFQNKNCLFFFSSLYTDLGRIMSKMMIFFH